MSWVYKNERNAQFTLIKFFHKKSPKLTNSLKQAVYLCISYQCDFTLSKLRFSFMFSLIHIPVDKTIRNNLYSTAWFNVVSVVKFE